jgi:hypothetical protein
VISSGDPHGGCRLFHARRLIGRAPREFLQPRDLVLQNSVLRRQRRRLLAQSSVFFLLPADPAFQPAHRCAESAQFRRQPNNQAAKVAHRQSFKRINVQALHRQLESRR